MQATSYSRVGIFWDLENCPVPSGASGYALVRNIRRAIQDLGIRTIHSFRGYQDVRESRNDKLSSELQLSGVSLIDTPHSGSKNVADQMMLVDIMLYSLESTPETAIIVLITGDRDFAYAISALVNRGYQVVLFVPTQAHASVCALASVVVNWNKGVLKGVEEEVVAPTVKVGAEIETAAQASASRLPPFLQGVSLPVTVAAAHPSTELHSQRTQPSISLQDSSLTLPVASPSFSPSCPMEITSPTWHTLYPFSRYSETDRHPSFSQSQTPSSLQSSMDSRISSSRDEYVTQPAMPAPVDKVSIASPKLSSSISPHTLEHTASIPTGKTLAPHFVPLVNALIRLRLDGASRPLRSLLGAKLGAATYQLAKASTFSQYIELARQEGIVAIGGSGSNAWVELM